MTTRKPIMSSTSHNNGSSMHFDLTGHIENGTSNHKSNELPFNMGSVVLNGGKGDANTNTIPMTDWSSSFPETITSPTFTPGRDLSSGPLSKTISPRPWPVDISTREDDLPLNPVPGKSKRKAPADQEGSEYGKPQHTASSSRGATMKRRATEPDLNGLIGQRNQIDAPADTNRTLSDPSVRMVLPAGKVFPIQVGDRTFHLSGASISSDAPSYFSKFFQQQLDQDGGLEKIKTLYIDRDSNTFEDIALHLQGYHVQPRDGTHFVRLFADAQFFSLPRLTAQLFSTTIFVRVGDTEFQIPRDVFSGPGDSPNYFSLGFSIFFTTPNDTFPGLTQENLLRPPSILPPAVPNRSAKTFGELLHFLKGYPIEIRNEAHRNELLRDARYFHLKGLEQRLIPHDISYNLARKRTEILIRLEDIRQSGISFLPDMTTPPSSKASNSDTASSTPAGSGWVYYQRPYIDSEAHALIVEIGGEEACCLSIGPTARTSAMRYARAMFFRQTLLRLTSLFSVIANKMNLPNTQPLGLMMERGGGLNSLPLTPGRTGVSQDRVKVCIGPEADVLVNGQKWSTLPVKPRNVAPKRGQQESDLTTDESEEMVNGEDWVVSKGQWRVRVAQSNIAGVDIHSSKPEVEVCLYAVKLEAHRSERGRIAARGFLT